jgi:citrate lyase gamma subunit
MIERLVRIRLQRQRVLERDPATELSVVLDESVLNRRIGDDRVMYEQLMRLADASEQPDITVRILPLSAQHSVFVESFVIFQFGPDSDAMMKDVVSSEHLKNAFSVESERDTYLHRLAFQTLLNASLNPEESRRLIVDTARSRWSNDRIPA